MPGKSVKIMAPATVANVGCGFDVLGFALDGVGDDMIIRLSDEPGIRITSIKGDDSLPKEADQNVSGVAVKAMLDKLDRDDLGVEIEMTKNVKPGSGLGSSASSSAGAVFGLNELLDRPFATKELVPFAMEGERLASGTPHADNVAPALLGGFVLVRSYQPLDIIELPCPEELYCTVIHPQIELRTEDSRNILKHHISVEDAVTQWGNLAGFISGLYQEDYDLMGRSMIDIVVEPIRSILIPQFDDLKKAAMGAGAMGCGISGSGPSVFALSRGIDRAKEVEKVMEEVYLNLDVSKRLYAVRLNPNGVTVIE